MRCECGAVLADGAWTGGRNPGGCDRADGSGVVYLVQRDNLDGLYLFADEGDRDAYAELFEGAETGTAYVMNRHQAALRIAEVCPAGCGESRFDCSCVPVEYRVTFGQRYQLELHPRLDGAHPDGWLAVIAPDEFSARVAVIDRIGRYWSCIYHPDEDGYPTADGLYPRGEIARMTVNP